MLTEMDMILRLTVMIMMPMSIRVQMTLIVMELIMTVMERLMTAM
jgi:hypothetical protein